MYCRIDSVHYKIVHRRNRFHVFSCTYIKDNVPTLADEEAEEDDGPLSNLKYEIANLGSGIKSQNILLIFKISERNYRNKNV